MIRVLLADDHPAVRVGLERLVRSEPGVVLAGSSADGPSTLAESRRIHPDCALIDYRMPGGGIELCRRLKDLDPAPGVVIFTAFAGERLGVGALVAGVNAMIDKSSPADEIFDAVRRAARGDSGIAPSQAALSDIAAELDAEQLPIFGMRVDGVPWNEIGETLRIEPDDLHQLAVRLLARIEARLANEAG